MADFGLSLALNTRPRDWGQVRQDRLMEVQMLKQMQTDLQSRIEKEAQARAGVVEYMSQIQKASVLSQDLERVKAVEAEERKKIVEGVQKAGNNYQKFLLGDGAAIMNSYYNNVMTSDAMVKAQKNKLNYAQASLDDYLGRWQRPVPDGKGGEISYKEAQAAFERGDTDVLDYQGSIQAPDMLKMQQIIQSTYGKDRYKKQPANKEDVYNLAIRSGAEDWAAKQIAEGYEGGVQSGAEPLYFKWDEPKQAATATGDLAKWFSQMYGTNLWKDYIDGNFSTQSVKTKWGDKAVVIRQTPLQGETMDKIADATNLKWSESDDAYKYTGDAILMKNGKQVKIPNLSIPKDGIMDYVTYTDPQTGGETSGLRVKVSLPSSGFREDFAKGSGFWTRTLGLSNDIKDDGFNMEGNIFGKRHYVAQAIIPLDKNSPIIRNAYVNPAREDEQYTSDFMQQMMPLYFQGMQVLNQGE